MSFEKGVEKYIFLLIRPLAWEGGRGAPSFSVPKYRSSLLCYHSLDGGESDATLSLWETLKESWEDQWGLPKEDQLIKPAATSEPKTIISPRNANEGGGWHHTWDWLQEW